MNLLAWGLAGYCLLSGMILGWLWAEAPLKAKIQKLEKDLMWESARRLAAESDLERARKKLELVPPQRKRKA